LNQVLPVAFACPGRARQTLTAKTDHVQSISDGSLVGIGTLQSAPAPRTSPPVMGGSPCPPTGQPAISSGTARPTTSMRKKFVWQTVTSVLLESGTTTNGEQLTPFWIRVGVVLTSVQMTSHVRATGTTMTVPQWSISGGDSTGVNKTSLGGTTKTSRTA